jgi:hypothetical protein
MYGGGGQSTSFLLKMGSENMFFYHNINFKKDIPVFLNKCPELVKMIQDKVYLKKDIEEIVTYYNAKCGVATKNWTLY